MRSYSLVTVAAFLLILGCTPKPPGIGEPIAWGKLEGWSKDQHAQTWPGFLKSCGKLDTAAWNQICDSARQMENPDDDKVREFFETHFSPHPIYAESGETQGLITGYYEPLLKGNWQPDATHRFPLYGVPDDLLIVDLAALYPELKGMRLRGKLEGRKIVPYPSREMTDNQQNLLKGAEVLWVDNQVDLFFLHIQGSGRVQMTDGSMVSVGYADQNGHPYRSIGKVLIEKGVLDKEEVNLFTIKEWLQKNPEQVNEILWKNPSYVFFELRDSREEFPRGSLNVVLTPGRSLAVDPSVIPLGAPVWLQTTLPDEEKSSFNQLMLAQDTGGAIKGHIRADVFWGRGSKAERLAGLMKQQGQMFVLLPKIIDESKRKDFEAVY